MNFRPEPQGHASLRPTPRKLIAVRQLEADPELVWVVLTTPEHLAAFWGGEHATVPPESVVVDLRVGGTFELETRSGDRSRRLLFRYQTIEPTRRLVLVEPRTGIETEIRLSPSGAGTTVEIHQTRLPPELRTEQARTGMAAILARLGDVVHGLAPTQEKGTT